MQPSRETNYYRIGIFVIISLTVLILTILVLGSGLLFKKTVYIETYFNDSIQGLSQGSPVKYRGLEIGHVKKLGFVTQFYSTHDKTYNKYIYCQIAITSNFLVNENTDQIDKIILQNVSKGLRIKLALQGLTGNAYLDIDYIDPKTNPTLPINWKPELPYIPSATSTLTRFSDNVQDILEKLKQININKVFDDLDDLIESANTTVDAINKIQLNKTFDDLDKLIKSADKTVKRADTILMRSNQRIFNILSNINSASENLRIVSENAKAYPTSFIFGKPPQPLDPNKL